MSLIKESLINALRNASVYNPDIQVAPACILWPDHDRQWESVIAQIQAGLPELFVLGDYVPEQKMGPAIWLRCVMAGKIENMRVPDGRIPIFYLPGISRQELRVSEHFPPDHLCPLVELQYRGVIWSQVNAKDWTVLAYLKSGDGGLALDVAQDNDTKNAMKLALPRLLDEDVDLIRGKRLDKDYFNTLLTGGDPIRDLLQWLDQGDSYIRSRSDNEWNAFAEVCKSQFGFNPQKQGVLAGAEELAVHNGPWNAVWERFCESASRYPNIPKQIRKCKHEFTLFDNTESAAGWPQWNEEKEKELRRDLRSLADVTPVQAQESLLRLESQHGSRRSLIWAELGEAPLARALEKLSVLAQLSKKKLVSGTADELVASYVEYGWKADYAVVEALKQVDNNDDYAAVAVAIRSVYQVWLEDSARHLQALFSRTAYPASAAAMKKHSWKDSTCILFVDGLRFDVGMRLSQGLKDAGYHVCENAMWSALPSVTATGKPAVTPVNDKIAGNDISIDFEPAVAATGQSLKGGYHLRKLLTDASWQILDRQSYGDGHGYAWCEVGDIDHEGHEHGWKLACQLDMILKDIHNQITALIVAGWKNVVVVTDHGWLLLPGGLPKIELESVLVESKWGRCAALKAGAATDERLYKWYWNAAQFFALADGISCFRKGEDYAHGGLSLQECLIPQLIVTREGQAASSASVEITDVGWKGLRCSVAVDGEFSGLSLDIRMHAGDASSSVVVCPKKLKDNGTASVVVEDNELEGKEAVVVLLDTDNVLTAQIPTVIGGGIK